MRVFLVLQPDLGLLLLARLSNLSKGLLPPYVGLPFYRGCFKTHFVYILLFKDIAAPCKHTKTLQGQPKPSIFMCEKQ
jgi:hypothetical protein